MFVYNTPKYDDFTGFTFNGQHSSQFGLLRTSNSDRYDDGLVLSHKNEAADIPGGPGQHYFGESLQSRSFSINVAYDNIGEVDKRRIKKWLHPDDKLHELIFDERPYVKYWVKCSKEVTASELCFNETYVDGTDIYGNPIEKIKRVYKGEFKIDFTAYMPYGIAVNKELSAYSDYANIDEWKEVCGLLTTTSMVDKFNELNAKIYNPGDVETGFKLTFELGSNSFMLEYVGEESAENEVDIGYHIMNQKLPENWGEQNYVIFDLGNKYALIKKGDTEAYLSDDKEERYMSGQIVEENSINKFESFDNGQLYDIYIEARNYEFINASNPIYLYSSISAITDSKSYYVFDNNNNSYYIYVCKSTGIEEQRVQFLNGTPSEKPDKLYIAQSNDVQIMFGLKQENEEPNDNQVVFLDNYYCTLQIPSSASTKPSDWSEAQKMLFNGGKVIIDTNKKTINYEHKYFEDKTELIGVSGIIKQGTLFKLPVDDFVKFIDKGEKNYGYKTFLIQPDEYTTITNPTIEYNYLYK